jgi:signal transduction histidine kinase
MSDESRQPRLQVLLLEDNDLDAELVLHQLAEGGLACATSRVQSRSEFLSALARGGWDVVLADYSLPTFDGATALALVRERCPDVPFIFVSGAIGEEVAIETLKAGATDYVLKHRLERLVPAVRRALAEVRERAERRRLEGELRQRAEELAEADRRKDEFLALLSHELRNPLAPVRNALQLMRHQGLPNPAVGRAWEIMDRQVENLSRLVDDLLDVSRITRGKIHLQKKRVDLTVSAETAVETARPLIEKRGHRVTTAFAPEPIWVEGDRVRLDQIAGNLVTNAAKYTDPGGRIEVRTRREGDQAVLSVQDTGIGIAPENQAAVFDMFVQADRSPDRTQGGLGIGLTLARRLVELHGGTIRVASEGLGLGSEFTVHLPLARTLNREDLPAVIPTAPGAPNTPMSRVVVVDDNRDGAESLAMLLRLWGHEVELAHDGPAAVRLVGDVRPGLALIDIGLPGMDGYQVARQIRGGPGPRVVLAAMTGYGQDEDRRRSREAGFDHHLTKPIDPVSLRGLIADVGSAAG